MCRKIAALVAAALLLLGAPLTGQIQQPGKKSAQGPVNRVSLAQAAAFAPCKSVSMEIISPVVTEFVPNNMPGDSWEIVIEASLNQGGMINPIKVNESYNNPPPGLLGALPTDVNGDMIPGDPNPFFPDLVVTLDEPFMVVGIMLPPGTNIASLFHKSGSEKELDGTQTSTFAMTVDPNIAFIVDSIPDGWATIFTGLRSANDSVRIQLGNPTANLGQGEYPQPPTIAFFTPDWVSAFDFCSCSTTWAIGIEVRIPALIQEGGTAFAWDPIPGPWVPPMGTIPQIQTGFSYSPPGPGFPNINFPTLVLVFSDDFVHNPTGLPFLGGTINGADPTNPGTFRVTGQNLASLIQEVGVTYWYGVKGFPDDPFGPETLKDDQLIYRFVFHVEGIVFDTDVLPGEMIATAGIITNGGAMAITNVRLKHVNHFVTPDP